MIWNEWIGVISSIKVVWYWRCWWYLKSLIFSCKGKEAKNEFFSSMHLSVQILSFISSKGMVTGRKHPVIVFCIIGSIHVLRMGGWRSRNGMGMTVFKHYVPKTKILTSGTCLSLLYFHFLIPCVGIDDIFCVRVLLKLSDMKLGIISHLGSVLLLKN